MQACSIAILTWWWFICQQDNDPEHRAKILKEWLEDNSVNALKWPSQSQDLNASECLWRGLKMAVHWPCPSKLMELVKLPKDRAKLVASYSKWLETVIATKGIEKRLWTHLIFVTCALFPHFFSLKFFANSFSHKEKQFLKKKRKLFLNQIKQGEKKNCVFMAWRGLRLFRDCAWK